MSAWQSGLSALSADQRELFELLLERQERASTPPSTSWRLAPPLGPDPTETAPLSFSQERIWVLQQLAPNSVAYHVAGAARVGVTLDPTLVERVVQEMVERHAILRTSFPVANGEPMQRIHATAAISLEWLDLTGLPEAIRSAETTRCTRALATRPFDLASGPLLRVALLRTGATETVLAYCTHHLVLDGWSAGLLLREVIELYVAFLAGRPSPLPELSAQYAEFARAQRAELHEEAFLRDLAYWRERLAGELPVLELPADRPRPPVQTYRGAREWYSLPPDLSKRLRALARREGVTLFTALLAAYQVLLLRYTHDDDVVVGTVVSNRTRRDAEAIVGPFANALVLRTDLSGDPSFRDLLVRTTDTLRGAYAHQQVPFELLLRELRPARDPSRSPLFQTLFLLHDVRRTGIERLPVPFAPMPIDCGTTRFDLSVEWIDSDPSLSACFEYSTDLFDAPTILRMQQHLERVVDAAVGDPERRISTIALLEDADRPELESRNESEFAPSALLPVHELFEHQADRNLDATALFCGERSLSYRELDELANRLAHRLRRLGAGPEIVVAIALERSIDAVVAVLAVLKTGAAYLPLDPEHPRERLAGMLRDSDARIAVTHERLKQRLLDFDRRILALDAPEESAAIQREPARRLSQAVLSRQLAYVIFTSGSTGRPKGVMVEHGGIARFFQAVDTSLGGDADDVWLASTTLGFDPSILELLWTLTRGSSVVLHPETLTATSRTAELMSRHGVTALQCTPSAAVALLLDPETRSAVRSLRTILLGGESLRAELVRELRALTRARILNMYGPTETTIWSATHAVEAADDPIPIGRPLPGARFYVVDSRLELVPTGVPGELCIGGVGVGRGYRARSSSTADRFLPDPFCGVPGARLYRTGDRVRRRTDGNLEFLGRFDHQVKLRGHRIELGEIESVLSRHPGVRELAVVLHEARDQGRLVACVVPREDRELDVSALREHASELLPTYMVPALFVERGALPKTSTGKIDRRRLVASLSEHALPRRPYVPPRTAAEELLSEVWAQVLGVSRVGIEDNFFELGGDSILAIRVRARSRRFGFDFAPPDLFRYPTVAELAKHMGALLGTEPESRVAPFELISDDDRGKLPADVEDAYPLSRLQAGMLFHATLEPDSVLYHDVFSIELGLPVDPDRLRRAISRLLVRHPVLRTSFDLARFHEPLQLVHRSVPTPLEIIDLSASDAFERKTAVDAWLEAERRRPFALADAPQLRFALHCLCKDSVRLSVSFHHAVLDGWSLASLLTELVADYAAVAAGTAEEEPSPPAAYYRDYVALEREIERSDASRRFWDDRLRDASPTLLRPPRARVRGAPHAVDHDVEVPPDLARALRERAAAEGLPLRSLLLAAHVRVLAALTGRAEILTGLVVHGRPAIADGERVLGLFVNTVPLRLEAAGRSWRDLARGAFEAERELLPHRRYPLAEIQKRSGRPVLFDVAFNMSHFHVYEGLLGVNGLPVRAPRFLEETNFALVVNVFVDPASGALRIRLSHDSAALDADAGDRVAGYYLRALDAVARQPALPCEASDLLGDAERHLQLVEWNQTAGPPARGATVVHRISERARRRPDALAIACSSRRWTYRELHCSAERLAETLRARGVGPEVRVAVCLRRSPEWVAALLGVWLAGAAYVPLDPSAPAPRLALLMRDSRATCLLTTEELGERFTGLEVPCLTLETLGLGEARPRSATRNDVGTDVKPPCVGGNLAYVIYTSGSSGTPKGVEVQHDSLLNLVDGYRDAYDVRATDRAGQIAAPVFDASVWELWAHLAAGASVHLGDDEVRADPTRAIQWIGDESLTVAFFPTPLVEAALQLRRPFPRCLRLLATGGDRLRQAPEEDPGVPFVNLYGPTECTVYATSAPVLPAPTDASPPPIGRPIRGVRTYLLDPQLRPVPLGAEGEICIGGAAVARGYLGRARLTAERFVPDPFGEPGSRMYRSGDLGCYRADGTLEYRGRIDRQLNIRGFRIEPGEIEAELLRHPALREVAVVDRIDPRGRPSLVAYVSGEDASQPNEPALRLWLSRRLPGYMIPTRFLRVSSLPWTLSGKLDRAALPDPGERPLAPLEPPRTPTERAVADLWRELFEVSEVGREDHFFALGGDSLLAMQLVARTKERLGVELPVGRVFAAPSLAALAEELENLQRRGGPGTSGAASGGDASASLDLRAEVVLAFEIPSNASSLTSREPIRDPTHVFLTGATGFLGSFLLYELLVRTRASVHCLVRAGTRTQASERLRDALGAYGLWQPRFAPRLVPVLGDLSQKRLGLPEATFKELGETLDVVYHSGATVNFLAPYEALRDTNVLGTHEALRLACEGRIKPVQYVSTLSVFESPAYWTAPRLLEDDPLQSPDGLWLGYSSSKWVAEKLVALGRDRGLPVSIYRPGRIAGHSHNGAWNTGDLASRLVFGCLQLGLVPDLDFPLELTPVDYVSRAIVHLATSQPPGGIYHLANPRPATLSFLLDWARARGFSLRPAPYREWRAALLSSLDAETSNPLGSLVPLLPDWLGDVIGARPAAGGPTPAPFVDCRHALAGLVHTDIRCPPVNADLLETYARFLMREGLIQAPGRQPGAGCSPPKGGSPCPST